MIISFHKHEDDTQNPTILYMCTTMTFERMLEEIASMQMDDLIGDDGIGPMYSDEPFMLDHIYMN
jgi:hypothetical protein